MLALMFSAPFFCKDRYRLYHMVYHMALNLYGHLYTEDFIGLSGFYSLARGFSPD